MLDEIKKYINDNNLPQLRIQQLEGAFFKKFATTFDEITYFPKILREELNTKFKLCSLELIEIKKSPDSMKFILKTQDGHFIESVLMIHKDNRRTVCVSSQIFCNLGCKFCATGAQPFKRNLTAQEILEQVIFISKHLKQTKERVSNVVFMGMGEPFLNYENLIESIKILNDENFFKIGARHIIVSTAGIVPKIKEFANLGLQIRLAVSLHAPTDELRSKLMPINNEYNLSELFEATDYFTEQTNKKVSYEYVLIKGINSSKQHAEQLAQLLKERLAYVNLLIYNPHQFADFEKPTPETVFNFKKVLELHHIECSIRKSLGTGIDGACGQLAGNQKK